MKKLHYAWVIIFVTFMALLAVQGVRLSFGAFIEPWENHFHIDRGTISLVSMVSFIVYGFSQPLVGRFIDQYGPKRIIIASILLVAMSIFLISFTQHIWQLFLLYGLTLSLGVGGASNVVASVIVDNWFNEKKGIAFGFVEAGFGAGQMLIVPGSLLMIHHFDWKTALWLLTGLLLFIILPIVIIFLKDTPETVQFQPLGQQVSHSEKHLHVSSITITEAIKMKEFWCVIIPFMVCGFTTTGLMDTHLIPFSHDHGFSMQVTSAAVSLLAFFNIIGILLSGVIADSWNSRKLLMILYFIRALSMMIVLSGHHSSLLIVFAVIFGLVDFATVAPTQVLAIATFKKYSVGFIMGWLFFGHQVGSALGSYIPGMLFAEHGSYNEAFYISIVSLLMTVVLVYLLPEDRHASHKKS